MNYRGIAWVTAIQVVITLLAHAAGVMGESLLIKVYGLLPGAGPDMTLFLAHHGLWLLFVPIVWFAVALAIMKATERPVMMGIWLALGAGIIVIIGLAAGAAAMYPILGGCPRLGS